MNPELIKQYSYKYKPDGSKFKFMLLDAHALTLNYLHRIISMIDGEIIFEGSDGHKALDNYIEYKPDLIIMEILLPGINGISITRSIMSFNPNAVIIAMSLTNNFEIIRQSVLSGAKHYIIKPIKTSDAINVITCVLMKYFPCMSKMTSMGKIEKD